MTSGGGFSSSCKKSAFFSTRRTAKTHPPERSACSINSASRGLSSSSRMRRSFFMRGQFGFGQRKIEGRAPIHGTLGPRPPAVPLHNPPHLGQTHANAFKLRAGMQPLEDAEELGPILHVETDAVIADEDNRFLVGGGRADFNPG